MSVSGLHLLASLRGIGASGAAGAVVSAMRFVSVILLVCAACDPASRFEGGRAPPPLGVTLQGSHGSTAALTQVSGRLLVVDPEESAVALIDAPSSFTSGGVVASRQVPQGSLPESVACPRLGAGPCWVALRADGSVVSLDAATLDLTDRWYVGAEPTGVAVSPSGRFVAVALFGEGQLVVLDTTSGVVRRVDTGGPARAVAITDDGDTDDEDETAWVTRYYATPRLGWSEGHVLEVALRSGAVLADVAIEPGLITGECVPNLLATIVTAGPFVAVGYQCTRPFPTTAPQRIEAAVALIERGPLVVHTSPVSRPAIGPDVADLSLRVEEGSPLVVKLDALSQAAGAVATLSGPVDQLRLEQVVGTVSLDCMPIAPSPSLGPYQPTAPPPGCTSRVLSPVGSQHPFVGVPTSVTRLSTTMVGVVDRTSQSIAFLGSAGASSQRVGFAPDVPLPATKAKELAGRLHFTTGLGRWSAPSARLACTSCHPDGLADSLTWSFSTGPRQTISLDSAYAKGAPADHRAQNWTAVADELSDVEHLVRTFMGGLGALTSRTAEGFDERRIPLDAAQLDLRLFTRNDGLSGSSMDVARRVALVEDWQHLDTWVQTIRTPRAPVFVDAAQVRRGRQVFSDAGCHRCHGGPKWTVSRVPWVPSPSRNGSRVGEGGLPPTEASGLRLEPRSNRALPFGRDVTPDTMKVAPEEYSLGTTGGVVNLTVGPERITCVLRNVSTFDAAEVTANGGRAQGLLGYNVPSLLGLATSAPYLHHGRARRLEDLFAAPWLAHARVGNPRFLTGASADARDVADLVAFLKSIDQTTPPFVVPESDDLCLGE